jgi:mRNA-degrading endonuclease RelE of RelBE toxin-antitoxin system
MQFRRTERFKKAFRALPASIQQKAIKALRLLAENPRHPSLQVKKIQGMENIWEGRVDQKYRFTFQFENENDQIVVVLRNIDNHDDCLKNP